MIYVFGCFGNGHHLYAAHRGPVGLSPFDQGVMEAALDRIPKTRTEDQIEGQIVHVPAPSGWSYVTWWDRQGDPRGNSHTGILKRGTWTAQDLLHAARVAAPWAFRVEVTL